MITIEALKQEDMPQLIELYKEEGKSYELFSLRQRT